MANLRKNAVMILSGAAVLAAIIGVYRAIHSPLFTVQVVEVTDQVSASQAAPVDPQTVAELAAVPVGQTNLFDLDLARVEKRILSNEWIRDVHLQKRFPQTLSITTVFREPKAIIELDTGALAYVDSEGKVFGKVSLSGPKNLPLFSGADSENPAQLKGLLNLLAGWESRPVSSFARIESMRLEEERGYRLMISYTLDQHLIHARVDLGSEVSPEEEDSQLSRLSRVLEYLHSHHIAARQIFADVGKKIVVKTAHGS